MYQCLYTILCRQRTKSDERIPCSTKEGGVTEQLEYLWEKDTFLSICYHKIPDIALALEYQRQFLFSNSKSDLENNPIVASLRICKPATHRKRFNHTEDGSRP